MRTTIHLPEDFKEKLPEDFKEKVAYMKRELIRDLTEFHPLNENSCLKAAKLKHTFGLSSVDAMIVGIALASHCKMLLTTDRASLANRMRGAQLGMRIKVVS